MELRLDVLLPRIWGGLSVIHVSINIVQLSQMDINKAKSSLKMNLGLGSNQKSDGLNQVERLRRELQEAHNLVCSLRAQVDQKEHIAALALSGSRVSSHESHDLQKIVCNPRFASHKTHTHTLGLGISSPPATAFSFASFGFTFSWTLICGPAESQ